MLLITLADVARNDAEARSDLWADQIAELSADAADLLPECVEVLALAARPPTTPVVRGAKIGRNDPCPCGSGRKHRKCCGAG